MKINVSTKLSDACLICLLITLSSSCFSNNDDEKHSQTRKIEVANHSGTFLVLDIEEQDCLPSREGIQKCQLLLAAHTLHSEENSTDRGYPDAMDIGGMRILSTQTTGQASTGELTLMTSSPVTGATLFYAANFRQLGPNVHNDPLLTLLMSALHPVLLEQIGLSMEKEDSEWKRNTVPNQYFITPKLTPLPEWIRKQIPPETLKQFIIADLGDHYTLLIRLDQDRQPAKVYIEDRLPPSVRTLKPYVRNLLGYANLLELFHHVREFEGHGSGALDLYKNPAKRTKAAMASNSIGTPLHGLETWDHYCQVNEYWQPQDVLKEEADTGEQALEGIHTAHSAWELFEAFLYPNDMTTRVLRTASLILTGINLVKDQLPDDHFEAAPHELIKHFLANEFNITITHDMKDEL